MEYKYKASCTKTQLKEIRDFVQDVLQNYTLNEVEIGQMVLAVDEVCANLIIHSHHCNPTEHIQLKIQIDEKIGITFEITDQGEAFNILNYKEPNLDHIINTRKKGGVGLMLVRRIMDKIEFSCNKKTRYNVCRLSKNLELTQKKK